MSERAIRDYAVATSLLANQGRSLGMRDYMLSRLTVRFDDECDGLVNEWHNGEVVAMYLYPHTPILIEVI